MFFKEYPCKIICACLYIHMINAFFKKWSSGYIGDDFFRAILPCAP